MITVRQAVAADLDLVAPLMDAYRQFYGRASDVHAVRAFLCQRFEHGESTIFLACEQEEVLGFTQLYPSFSSVSLARIFVLNDLYVAAHARKKGVAPRLLAAATDYARTMGAVRLTLSTASTNSTAQALYESQGWQRDDQYFHYNFAIER